ncbi:MAG: C40 family peptidase [Leptolyngbyaceae cyanobacterium bins.59]|nr:C40 family peptidase [Leptolyngbyaceae cyanobacterium bins.59]
MVSLDITRSLLNPDPSVEYVCRANLNLYDSDQCDRLATQARSGRHLRIVSRSLTDGGATAIQVCLCEDDYPGWLLPGDLEYLIPASEPYQPKLLDRAAIEPRLPQVMTFANEAMHQPNFYLWGGTVGPNYDCSGLVQAAFTSVGVWVPRDAYQQEAFTQSIALPEIRPGDLIFFGPPDKATHVGLCLTADSYIHSSGTAQGRNGIGIDFLTTEGDAVSRAYYAQVRGAGRVIKSYQPIGGSNSST